MKQEHLTVSNRVMGVTRENMDIVDLREQRCCVTLVFEFRYRVVELWVTMGFSAGFGRWLFPYYDYSGDPSTKKSLARSASSHLVLRKLSKTPCAFEVETEPAR